MNALKNIIKDAKALKKKFPKRFAKWTDYVKQASAIKYSKAKKAVKKGVKKTLLKTARSKYLKGNPNRESKHKDINSHNVKLTIMSGIDKNDILNQIERLIKYNKEIEGYIEKQKHRVKTDKSNTFVTLQKRIVLSSIKRYKELLSANKKYLSQLKKQL